MKLIYVLNGAYSGIKCTCTGNRREYNYASCIIILCFISVLLG